MTRATQTAARLVTASVLLWLTTVLVAGAAAAEPAEGWPENPPVDLLNALLLVGGVTLAVILTITVLVVGPGLARGEGLAPGVAPVEDQWLGGPRRSAGELAAPGTQDPQESHVGGAGARW